MIVLMICLYRRICFFYELFDENRNSIKNDYKSVNEVSTLEVYKLYL